MELVADKYDYDGTLTAEGQNSWAYNATAQYTDEGGVIWTSTILVEATQVSADEFTGTMQGSIASSSDGNLYMGEWDVTGTR